MADPTPPPLVHELIRDDGPTLAPTLDEAHAPNKTIAWCATLQLVWNEVRDVTTGRALLSPPVALADSLNAGAARQSDIDPASCTTEVKVNPSSLAIHTKLAKTVRFLAPFAANEDGTWLRFRGCPVASFGAGGGNSFAQGVSNETGAIVTGANGGKVPFHAHRTPGGGRLYTDHYSPTGAGHWKTVGPQHNTHVTQTLPPVQPRVPPHFAPSQVETRPISPWVSQQ